MTGDKSNKPLLELQDLRVVFDTENGVLTAVDGVSFILRHGETLGLVGESGCGKTVTAMSILRLVPSPPGRIVSGKVLFEGEDLLKVPPARMRELRGGSAGMVFQDPMTALSPLVRVGDQLVESIRLHKNISRQEAMNQAEEWLAKVGLPDPAARLKDFPHQLSGGMQQRVMIASALMPEPQLLIADEPTTALDVTLQAQILELLSRLKDKQAGLLLITHDMSVVWQVCDRVAVMYAGELVEIAPAEDLFRNPAHPYTQALLAALPGSSRRGSRLPAISGSVPTLHDIPIGCRFAPRCKYAREICHISHPELKAVGKEGHLARCFFSGELAAENMREAAQNGDSVQISLRGCSND